MLILWNLAQRGAHSGDVTGGSQQKLRDDVRINTSKFNLDDNKKVCSIYTYRVPLINIVNADVSSKCLYTNFLAEMNKNTRITH